MLMQLPVTGASLSRKVAQLKELQKVGRIDDTLRPDQLLLVLLAIIHADGAERETVALAVQQLIRR
jgi:hypothetical protein